FPGDNLVRDYFHDHVDHSFNFCGAENRTHVRAFRCETFADKVAAGHASTVRTADVSTKSGAKPEIIYLRNNLFSGESGVLARPAEARRPLLHRLLIAQSCHQKGIPFPLFPYRRARAVAWYYQRVVRQGEDAVAQRAHDLFERSSREIGASDAASEQSIARDQ